MGRQCPSIVFPVLVLLATVTGLHVVNALATTTDSSVEHEVKAIVQSAQPVHLPCDLGISECDSPVHNIKVYKNDVRFYVYVNSSDPSVAMDKAERDWTKRAHLNLTVDPPVITLDPAFRMDFGRYRCEVTYVEVLDNCRTSSYVNLIMLNQPSIPEISYAGELVKADLNRIGPVVEGTRVTLHCEASNGDPPAEVTWWNGTEKIADSRSKQASSTINIKLTRADLHSTFECQAMNEALVTPLASQLYVDVQTRPLSVRISELDAPVVEGDLVNITCLAEGARPEATIVWFNDSKELASNANIKTETFVDRLIDPKGSNYTFSTRSEYSFTATMYDNGKRVHCQAENVIMTDRKEPPMEDFLYLNVLYAPRVTLYPSGVVQINHNDKMTMKCQFDANPENLTQIIWLKDGDEVDFNDPNYTDDDDYDDEDDDDDDTESDDSSDEDEFPILHIRRVTHLNKGTYSCKLINSVGAGVSSTLLTLDVYYPPITEITIIPDVISEHEHENVTLECNIVTANPPDANRFRWLKEGLFLEETENNTHVVVSPNRSHVGNYSCQAQNTMGYGPKSEFAQLFVQYLPGYSLMSHEPAFAIKNQSVTLSCTIADLGHPPAFRYRWYRDQFLLVDEDDHQYFIPKVTTETLSNYSCTALNELGEGPRSFMTIPVMAPPAFIQKLPDSHGASENATNVSLSCQVECRPLCVIHWLKNSIPITKENKNYRIETKLYDVDLAENRMDSIFSKLIWELDTWPEGHLIRNVDNAEYTCISSDNLVGFEVKNTTKFSVEYPPEDIRLSSESQDVVEDSIPLPVTCTASGFPQVEYMWMFDGKVVPGSTLLALNFTIKRNLGGNYTCIAYNKHGNLTASTFINVVYAPTCEIRSETSAGGQVTVSCSVDANPSEVDFEWRLNNQTFTDDIETDGLLSRVEFHESDEHYGNYTCVASNAIGVSQPCWLEVSREGGWLEKLSETQTIFIIAAVIGVLILLIVILILVYLCKRKSKNAEKDKVKLEERQTPEGVQNDITPVFRPVAPADDETAPSDNKKKKPLPSKEPDAKAFYENLPFHGLQPPPNKHARPIPAPRNHYPTIKAKPVYENLSYFPKLFTQPIFRKDKPFKPILPDLEYADVDFPSQPLNNNAPFSKAKIVERILEEADEEPPSGKTPARPPRSKAAPRT